MKQHLAGALVGAALALGGVSWLDRDTDPHGPLVAYLEVEEGFKAHIYSDSRGVPTIGYGTALDQGISREEAGYLLAHRARRNAEELVKLWPSLAHQPDDVRQALEDMAYQIGAEGVAGDPRVRASGDCDKPRAERPHHGCGFHDMLDALESGDRATAAREALNSAWARETPKRAARVAARLRGNTAQ